MPGHYSQVQRFVTNGVGVLLCEAIALSVQSPASLALTGRLAGLIEKVFVLVARSGLSATPTQAGFSLREQCLRSGTALLHDA